jgi:hypothetical protein
MTYIRSRSTEPIASLVTSMIVVAAVVFEKHPTQDISRKSPFATTE